MAPSHSKFKKLLLSRKPQLDQMTVMDNDNVYYFVFYEISGVIVRVSKNTFCKLEAKCFTMGNYKIKLVLPYKSEGYIENIKQFYNGIEVIFSIIMKFGSLKKLGEKFTLYAAHVFRLILDIKRVLMNPVTLEDVISIVLSLFIAQSEFKAESLDSFLLAGASMFLPKAVLELIKRMQYFSSAKIADDITMLHSFVGMAIDVFRNLSSLLRLPNWIKDPIEKMFDSFGLLKHHFLIKEVDAMLDFVKKNPQSVANEGFRENISKLKEKLSNEPSVWDWCRRSESVKRLMNAFDRLVVLSKQYDNVSRQEPACYIFEGPPGCMKSVLMQSIIKAQGVPAYSHMVKPATEGKDWFDNYDNQDIIYMDDIGQMCLSQWRTIINMVSGIVLPLDCARAELKDTKFFNSSKIFVTTNKFKDLQLRTDCGIENLEALHRRGLIFNMKSVTRKLGTPHIVGTVTFEFYNLKTKEFEVGFPHDVRELLDKHCGIRPSYTFIGKNFEIEKVLFVKWASQIVTMIDRVKNDQYKKNIMVNTNMQLVVDEINRIKDLQLEGGFTTFEVEPPKTGQMMTLLPGVNDHMDINSRWRVPLGDNTFLSPGDKPGRLTQTYYSPVFKYTYTVSEEDSYEFLQRTFPLETFQVIPRRQKIDYSFKIACKSFWNFIWGIEASTFKESASYWIEYIVNVVKETIELVVDAWMKLTSWLDTDFKMTMATVSLQLVLVVILAYVVFPGAPEYKMESHVEIFRKSSLEEFPTPIRAISKNMYLISLSGNVNMSCYGLVSGRRILIPNHMLIHNPNYITIWRATDSQHALVDKEVFDIIYQSKVEDVAVLKLRDTYPAPFRNISSFMTMNLSHGDDILVNGDGALNLGEFRSNAACPKTYTTANGVVLNLLDGITYSVRGNSMCGTLYVNKSGMIKGMHVAGSVSQNIGVSLIWSEPVRNKIAQMLDDRILPLPYQISEKVMGEFSGIKLDANFKVFASNKSNIVPSALNGIYECSREPADLKKYGAHTVKDVAKKSFKPVRDVDDDEIAFGVKVLDSILEPFTDITWKEVVNGGDGLAPLNKDSSNGYKCKKLKSDYVNFEKGEILEETQKELDRLNSLANRFEELDEQEMREFYDSFVWCEALKDELRSVSKEGVPRSFRVGTIHSQLFTKKICGNMIRDLMKTRNFHQIMIGVNPYEEWDNIAKKLSTACYLWAGDVAKWDGSMLPQVQRAIFDLLLSKYKGYYSAIFKHILESTIHSLIAMNDDVVLSTHSMPSGSYLTAMLNSLVNKFYTAMWFYREMKAHGQQPTVTKFWAVVVDYVYGDDKLNAILDQNLNFLNAITMRDFFQSIGMDFTDANKRPIVNEAQNIEDVTFLKRSFVFHHILGKVMCPLDWNTLSTSMQWIDKTKEVDVVMRDKLNAFQRELYLYPDYEVRLGDFRKRISKFNVTLEELPSCYLRNVYSNVSEEFLYY